MTELIFATGNSDKFATAEHTCHARGHSIQQVVCDIDEVQSEDSIYIARKKADEAYRQLNKPVIISDDSWSIHGLRGFPGAYMKSMNHWFTTDDFLRLTAGLEDRSCTLTQILVYQDDTRQKVFVREVPGTVLTAARGTSSIPWLEIVVLDGDNDRTMAEMTNLRIDRSDRDAAKIWHELLDWLETSTT